jgi:hypothetical protein
MQQSGPIFCSNTLDTNVRIHGETRKKPLELFPSEKQHLKQLPALPADTGVIRTIRATNRFRVVLDTNRYSVPSLYASQRLLLKTLPIGSVSRPLPS